MVLAFLWSFLSASSLLLGSIFELVFKPKKKYLGLIMAFGVGVLISAVSFELVNEAFISSHNWLLVIFGLMLGSIIFIILDLLIVNNGGRDHKIHSSVIKNTNGFTVLLGTILDGIPESMIIGLSLASGASVSYVMVVAVFLSNLPEAIASTNGLKKYWSEVKIAWFWLSVAIFSGMFSIIGFVAFSDLGGNARAFMLTFSAGALLTMLADSMMPEAYKDSGKLAGVVTTIGFGVAYILSILS